MNITDVQMPLFISAFGFLVIFLFVLGIMGVYRQRTQNREFVEKIDQFGGELETLTNEASRAGNQSKIRSKTLGLLSALGMKLFPKKAVDYSGEKLRFLRGGLRGRNVPAVFWGTKFFLMLILGVCFLVMRVSIFGLLSPQATMAICLLLALVGFYLPDIWLAIRTRRRKRNIFEGFPDALDLLMVCVEAGMGLDAAVNRVAEELELSNKVLSEELKYLNLETRAGKSRHDAFRNLAIRTDLEDVHSLVTMLIQSDKFGTSMAKALRVYSDTFRTKRYQKAEEIAAKLPVKLVLPLILFIFPSLFVAILGPAGIRLYEVLLSR